MNVTVVVNELGQVIAAHVPASEEGDPGSGEEGRMTGFVPMEGQRVIDLDVSEDDVPSEPRSDFLNTLQTYKDRSSPETGA